MKIQDSVRESGTPAYWIISVSSRRCASFCYQAVLTEMVFHSQHMYENQDFCFSCICLVRVTALPWHCHGNAIVQSAYCIKIFLLVDAHCQGTMPPMLLQLAKRRPRRTRTPRRTSPRKLPRRRWRKPSRRQMTRTLVKMGKSQVMKPKVCFLWMTMMRMSGTPLPERRLGALSLSAVGLISETI